MKKHFHALHHVLQDIMVILQQKHAKIVMQTAIHAVFLLLIALLALFLKYFIIMHAYYSVL